MVIDNLIFMEYKLKFTFSIQMQFNSIQFFDECALRKWIRKWLTINELCLWLWAHEIMIVHLNFRQHFNDQVWDFIEVSIQSTRLSFQMQMHFRNWARDSSVYLFCFDLCMDFAWTLLWYLNYCGYNVYFYFCFINGIK